MAGAFPYKRFSEIRIRSSEPMSYAYFNAHIARLYANLRSMDASYTLQKAGYGQWGTVRFATPEDMVGNGDRTAVMTNAGLNSALDGVRSRNIMDLMVQGRMGFTAGHEFVRGSFTVGTGDKVVKKITDAPERVEHAYVTFVPLGYESSMFRTARVDSTALSAYENGVESSGTVNFVEWGAPEGYREFHVYYHRAGYVVCENGRYDDGQRQIRVEWTLFMRKGD